jgi:diphthine-ammonia ligase
MRVAVLATGGKDSTLALYRALSKGYEVAFLACMIPAKEDSYMFHYPNIHLIDLFAEAVEIPLVKAETSGIKELEVEDLKRLIEKLDVEGLVSGAIASNLPKNKNRTNLQTIKPRMHNSPLAGKPPKNSKRNFRPKI